MEFRLARPDEYAEAGRVTALAYREFVPEDAPNGWTDYLDRIADVPGRAPRTTIVVAVEDGTVLGSATLEIDGRTEEEDDRALDPDEAHIRMLGVDPAARGRGVAKGIMAECERIALDAGRTRMTLNTTSIMQAAQSMYESLGYRKLTDEMLPNGFVLMSYQKSLSR
jgi:ribosomal protein S18 acetylase RimI-like enzyme